MFRCKRQIRDCLHRLQSDRVFNLEIISAEWSHHPASTTALMALFCETRHQFFVRLHQWWIFTFSSRGRKVSLLEKISFYISSRIGRKRNNLFNLLSCRTKQFESAALDLYNQIHRIDKSIDIFLNSKPMFKRKIQEALLKLHWDTAQLLKE